MNGLLAFCVLSVDGYRPELEFRLPSDRLLLCHCVF